MFNRLISLFLIIVICLGTVTAFAEDGETVTEPVAQQTEAPVLVSSIKTMYPKKKTFSLAVKQSRTITVNVLPSEAENISLKWTTSDKSVVTVSKKGRVKGVSCGTAVITATAKDGSGVSIDYTVKIVKRKKGTNVKEKGLSVVSTKTAKYTYKQMKKDLKAIREKYPELMRYSSVGKTHDNRNIYEVVIGNEECDKHIFIQASMHAREYINSFLVMRQIESICLNYYSGTYKGKYYSELFDKTCLHIFPMANPDGVTISQYGADGIKDEKLRADVVKMFNKYGGGDTRYYTRWKANARGVDLNRNYPINFEQTAKRVKHPCSANYTGKFPASELETQVMIERFENIEPKTVIAYHSTGSIIYWDFLQKGELHKKNKSLFNVANSLTGYRAAKKTSFLYSCFGNWTGYTKVIPTLTIETGEGEAPIKKREIKTIWKKNRYMLPAVALWTKNNT